MFEVGDIVKIIKHPDAMEGSPADNLVDSIVEITHVAPYNKNSPRYCFKFIEKHAKNEEKCRDTDTSLAWDNDYFELVKECNAISVDETDVFNLLEGE